MPDKPVPGTVIRPPKGKRERFLRCERCGQLVQNTGSYGGLVRHRRPEGDRSHTARCHNGWRYRVEASDPSWRDRAACAGKEPMLFDQTNDRLALPALRICETCPVRAACWQWAANEGWFEGVAGGAIWRRSEVVKLNA